jgi:hypothetical protein
LKHAGSAALGQLSELIAQVRARPGLREKAPGVFYRKSKAFLHFHEDPAGLFADIRIGAEFERLAVNSKQGWAALLAAVDRAVMS